MAAWIDGVCVGIAIVGRPVARVLDQLGGVAEVTRVACTGGVRGVCSALVRACGKEAVSRGYTRVISYTILGETGACYRAARWWPVAICGGGEWNNKKRKRKPSEQPTKKVRWEFGPNAEPRNMEAWNALVANVGLVQISERERAPDCPLFSAK